MCTWPPPTPPRCPPAHPKPPPQPHTHLPAPPPSHAHLQVVPGFRVRTIPVLGTTPAIFGLAAASWALCQLAGAPYTPAPHFRVPVRAGRGWLAG